MSKMAAGDFETEEDLNKSKVVSDLDEKVVEAYKKLGIVLKTYRSGKLPKAFKVIPLVANWEELLFLTQPHKWSRHAVYESKDGVKVLFAGAPALGPREHSAVQKAGSTALHGHQEVNL